MHVVLLNLLCRFHLAWPGAFCLGSVSGRAYVRCFLSSVSEPLWETFFFFFCLFWVGHFSIHPFGFGLLLFFGPLPVSPSLLLLAGVLCGWCFLFVLCELYLGFAWAAPIMFIFLCVLLCFWLIDVFLGSCTLLDSSCIAIVEESVSLAFNLVCLEVAFTFYYASVVHGDHRA